MRLFIITNSSLDTQDGSPHNMLYFFFFFEQESLSLDGKLHIPLVQAISIKVLIFDPENLFCTEQTEMALVLKLSV